jgi:hypothetical protein
MQGWAVTMWRLHLLPRLHLLLWVVTTRVVAARLHLLLWVLDNMLVVAVVGRERSFPWGK